MGKKFTLIVFAVAALAVLGWFVFSPGPSAAPVTIAHEQPTHRASLPDVEKSTTLVSARPEIDHSDGYLGSESCKKCHEDYFDSWHTSYHRTMTQTITPDTAPTVIGNSDVSLQGEVYRFRRHQDDFWVDFEDPNALGKRITRRLVLMTGSHHAHVFWYESGLDKTPGQLPIMYLIDQQRWIPRESFFLRPPNMEKDSELGRWNAICCNCHSVHPRTRPDSDLPSWDTRVSDFGISCEACHGPGEAHVAFRQLDQGAVKSGTDPIVNPLDLPKSKRSDMCGQCHGVIMIDIDNTVDQEQFFSHGRQFRPGDQLDEAYFLRMVRAGEEQRKSETFRKFDAHAGAAVGHFWSDGQMRVTGRDYTGMIESKCFQEGELSCMSCHTMHQQDVALQSEWKDDQLMPSMRGDASCLQCHAEYEQLGSKHTHHTIESDGSRCMNCHMPHTDYGILKSSRSHTISSPSVSTTITTGRPNACNLCHLDHTLEQTADHLAQWYGHDKPRLTVDEQTTAASVLHFLSGDAGQRALQVNAFQWQPARDASGTDWMRLYLLLGMEDDYDAIRLISERAYKSLPNALPLQYDFLDTPQERMGVFGPEYERVLSERHDPNTALLIDSSGLFDKSRLGALMGARNQRPVYLQE